MGQYDGIFNSGDDNDDETEPKRLGSLSAQARPVDRHGIEAGA